MTFHVSQKYNNSAINQWRRQDFFSSGANVGRANVRSHGGAMRRVCVKHAPRREAPRSREARTEARSAESAHEARNRGAKRRVKSGGGVWGGGSVSPSPRKFLKF